MESLRQSVHCALQQFPVPFILIQEFMDQYLLKLHGGSGKLCLKRSRTSSLLKTKSAGVSTSGLPLDWTSSTKEWLG